jgi:LmbE family N-acetylglucosaminyl deacetylase
MIALLEALASLGKPKDPTVPVRRSKPQGRLFRFFSSRRRRFGELSARVRFAILVLALPLVVAGGASGAFYFRLHHLYDDQTTAGMPLIPQPRADQRILVLSPHCDDETLGAGELIADARRSGAEVRIAFLTNGDGFRVAASRTLGEVKVEPADFVRFAEVRQQEALRAARELGVPDNDVLFFGYPDRGLKPMWETNWDEQHLYRSAYTGHVRSPYAYSYTPHAPYCGASLVADLSRAMREFKPTDILVTHPADDHPDHGIAAAYVQAALRECERTGEAWARSAHLRYYIVHRGDWPLPQGLYPSRPLAPPPGLVALDTNWSIYPASSEARIAKAHALDQYESQLGVSGRFLRSFQRINEVFADLPEEHIPVVAPGDPKEAVALDARGDNVARYADPAADITGIGIRREGDLLRVRLQTRGRVSRRVHYQLTLRTAADDTGVSRFLTLDIPTTAADADGKGVKAAIPLRSLGIASSRPDRAVWVSGETRWAADLSVSVDHTGYRTFLLPGNLSRFVTTARPGD